MIETGDCLWASVAGEMTERVVAARTMWLRRGATSIVSMEAFICAAAYPQLGTRACTESTSMIGACVMTCTYMARKTMLSEKKARHKSHVVVLLTLSRKERVSDNSADELQTLLSAANGWICAEDALFDRYCPVGRSWWGCVVDDDDEFGKLSYDKAPESTSESDGSTSISKMSASSCGLGTMVSWVASTLHDERIPNSGMHAANRDTRFAFSASQSSADR